MSAQVLGRLQSGWLTGARLCPSPNFDHRPAGTVIDLVVIHAISLPPSSFGSGDIARLFTNTLSAQAHPYYPDICGLRVSAHFLLERDGGVVQFVSTDARAWHAGRSFWNGRAACNDFSIGIELEGCDDLPFEDAQYQSLNLLLDLLIRHYPIASIAGHSDIAPGRKTDPGPYFDWGALERGHLAELLRSRNTLSS